LFVIVARPFEVSSLCCNSIVFYLAYLLNIFFTIGEYFLSGKKGLIYDGKTGEKIGELSTEGGHTGSIYAVSWNPDSKQVI
jgi:hypothetical protein